MLTSLISFSAAEEALTPKTKDPFAEDPSKKDPFAAGVAEQKKEVKRELFMIKVIISNGKDEVGNFKAVCSNQSDGMGLFCKGSIVIDNTCQWRVMVNANLDDTKYADLEIVIDYLKAFTKSSEGIIQPMNVFTATQQ